MCIGLIHGINATLGSTLSSFLFNFNSNNNVSNSNNKNKVIPRIIAMRESLPISLIAKPGRYQKMVQDSLAEDFSWIQKGKQGPVYDYLDKVGIDRNNLPDVK